MKSLFTSLLLFTSLICLSQIQLKNGKIGIGLTNPVHDIHVKGPVHMTSNLTIGSGANGQLRARYINGKNINNDSYGQLFLSFHAPNRDVYVGRPVDNYRNNLRLFGSLIFDEFGGSLHMSDTGWIRSNKSILLTSGIIRVDGQLHRGPGGAHFISRWFKLANGSIVNRVGINKPNPSFDLDVNGTVGKSSGGSAWETYSDRNLKRNISQFEDGLDKVLKINPIWYQYNGKAGITDTKSKYVGIVAQEMQKIAPYTIKETLYQDSEEKMNDEGKIERKVLKEENYLSYDASAVTYMLVNSIKELHTMIEDLKLENMELKDQLDNIMNISLGTDDSLHIILSNAKKEMIPVLFQNRPNPYNGRTFIDYFIPENARTAVIAFYDLDGKLLKEESISQFGTGSLTVDGDDLISGSYLYTLFVDGVLISSSKMTVSK